jgi:hypothetical protein
MRGFVLDRGRAFPHLIGLKVKVIGLAIPGEHPINLAPVECCHECVELARSWGVYLTQTRTHAHTGISC